LKFKVMTDITFCKIFYVEANSVEESKKKTYAILRGIDRIDICKDVDGWIIVNKEILHTEELSKEGE